MKLHKEGNATLIIEILAFSIINYLAHTYVNEIVAILVCAITLFIFAMSVYFFRIPKRTFEKKDGVVYAPCDGKVVVIEKTTENSAYVMIKIFLDSPEQVKKLTEIFNNNFKDFSYSFYENQILH